MPRARLHRAGLAAVCLTGLLASLACEADRPKAIDSSPPRSDAGSGGSGGGGAGGNGGGAAPGDAGDAGDAGGGPAAQDGAPDVVIIVPPSEAGTCGDGVTSPDEDCDGASLGGSVCEDFGFAGGTLACTPDCALDFAGCVALERCHDGSDDDRDGLADCADPDCAAACANACAEPPLLALGTPTRGVLTGHAANAAGCAPSGGGELTFRVVAPAAGALDVVVVAEGADDLSLAVAESCAGAASTCVNSASGAGAVDRVTLDIAEGAETFLRVGSASGAAAFALTASFRVPECGDRMRDTGEECDDGNAEMGDGCAPDCTLEAGEQEPNDSVLLATDVAVGYIAGEISAASDVDLYRFALAAPVKSLSVDTLGIPRSACGDFSLDNRLELLAADGVTVLATDDDGGEGFCARIRASDLAAGTYMLRVRAAGTAKRFSYLLDLTKSP